MREWEDKGEGAGCHFENYVAAFFERYVVYPVCFANVTSRRSAFPSDNHAVMIWRRQHRIADI